jgi:hypothetical protein
MCISFRSDGHLVECISLRGTEGGKMCRSCGKGLGELHSQDIDFGESFLERVTQHVPLPATSTETRLFTYDNPSVN